MHPPLDRPHPDCQDEIDALRHCHGTNSKVKFWACNEIKTKLDTCFRLEKQRILKEMNKNFEVARNEEDKQFAASEGKTMTFQEHLAHDKTYLTELEEIKKTGSCATKWRFG
jgi:COX assembly mitochondrial protein 2